MHWLDWLHAPPSVWVVWSKIWIALLVPVMLVLAVAVRIVFSPDRMKVSLAARSMRSMGRPRRSDATGTLGVTIGGARVPRAGVGEGKRTAVHAGGLLSPTLPIVGHGD